MSIFGTTNRSSATATPVVEAYEGYVGEGLAGMQTILAESAQDAYNLLAGMYISDVIMEESVLEGAATPEVLMEGFMKDSFAKVRAMFEKLWSKVKAWFAKAKKHLQLVFTSGENFIKKYKTEIENKATGGFTYEGFAYDIAGGDGVADAKAKVLADTVADAVAFDIDHVSTEDQVNSIQGNAAKHKSSYNLSEEKEKVLTKLGNKELSSVLKGIIKAYRGNKEEKAEFKDFSGNSKAELVKIVEDSKGNIKKVESAQKVLDEQFARVLASIKKAESKIGSAEAKGEEASSKRAKAVAYAQHKYQLAQFAITTMSSISAAKVEAYKESAKHAESTLKSFLRYKPTKESFTPEGDLSNSILESAYRYV